jgi:hypothetical protein
VGYPALELVWSPTGRGSVVKGHLWSQRELIALPPGGLTFGLLGDVRVQYHTKHASEPVNAFKLEQRDGRLVLWRYASDPYCSVNGRVRKDRELELRHRDVVALPPGPVFRVHERQLVSARSPSLEAAIRTSPDDRELFQVYRDFLLDQGDPLGERIARSRLGPLDDDATWLDVLGIHYESGELQIEWTMGLATSAVLRETLAVFNDLEEGLQHLLELPVMRFLRELTLDVSSDRVNVAAGLEALSRVQLPATLRRVSLGDVPEADRRESELLLARFGKPVEVTFYNEAALEVLSSVPDANHKAGDNLRVGEQIELGRTGYSSHLSHNVLLGGSYLIARDGPRYVLARIVNSAAPPKVNGRAVDRFPLRDGDVIELAGELTAPFNLLR